MYRLFCLAVALAVAVLVSGCSTDMAPRGAIYSSAVRGQFEKDGEFSATFLFSISKDGKTFAGSLQDFRFSKKGLEHPLGAIPVQGTIGKAPNGDILLKGKGQGTLTQGSYAFQLEFQMESSYVDPAFKTVDAWYFGGGNLNRNGAFQEWPKLVGSFKAKALCTPNPYKACIMRPVAAVAAPVATAGATAAPQN